MPWRVITPPAEEPVSVSEVKAYLRLETDADDAAVDALIAQARGYAEFYLERALVTQTLRATFDRFPGGDLLLPMPPLQSVTQVSYLDTDWVSQVLGPALYEADTVSEPGRLLLGRSQYWPVTRSQESAVSVTFVAGYGSAAAVPPGIKLALQVYAVLMYEKRLPDPEVLKPVDRLLDPYRWKVHD